MMKKGMIILEDGFEQVEALATHDVLRRTHNVQIDLVGGSKLQVATSSGVIVHANYVLKDINPDEYDFIVLPGGKLGVDNLGSNPLVISLIHKFFKEGKHVHAICAAPYILGKLGYLNNKKYTCFPGFEDPSWGTYIDTGVVRDDNLITGHSMGYSVEFAREIVKLELGEQYLLGVDAGVFGK